MDPSLVGSACHNAEPPPIYDNFFSPENRAFYSQKPYKALDQSQQQLRLLKLLPAETTSDGELSFTLLDQVPRTAGTRVRYTALSYCAGDPKKIVPIRVNGIKFNAFANLGHALKEVMIYWEKNGRKREEECLWADQICIDQSNPDERSHQVGMMRDIYSGAERVLVCLAERESNGVGVQWAIEVHQWLQGVNATDKSLRAEYFDKNTDRSPWWRGMNAFLKLLLTTWWTRAWICQEFILAAKADFLHGGNSISWQDFALVLLSFRLQFLTYIAYSRNYLPDGHASRHPANQDPYAGSPAALLEIERGNAARGRLESACRLISNKQEWASPRDLKVWLQHAASCEASDPRDKVFAFLGLAAKGYEVEPDYSTPRSMAELCIYTTQKIIEYEKGADFLHCIPAGRVLNDGSLPSWVPDWTSKGAQGQPVISFPTLKKQEGDQFVPEILRGNVLRITGLRIGIIGGNEMDWVPGSSTYSVITKGLCISWWPLDKIRPNDCVWYFPGNAGLFVLRPHGEHWLFLSVTKLRKPYYNENAPGTYTATLILNGDFHGLCQLFEEETIEIH